MTEICLPSTFKLLRIFMISKTSFDPSEGVPSHVQSRRMSVKATGTLSIVGEERRERGLPKYPCLLINRTSTCHSRKIRFYDTLGPCNLRLRLTSGRTIAELRFTCSLCVVSKNCPRFWSQSGVRGCFFFVGVLCSRTNIIEKSQLLRSCHWTSFDSTDRRSQAFDLRAIKTGISAPVVGISDR
jgi:hypothetical protein